MFSVLSAVIPGLFKIGDKLIEDKDKRNEYAFKVQEMAFSMMSVMLNTKTYPWIDGLVKISYAADQIIKGLFRPLFSFGLFVYGLINPEILTYLHEIGVVGDAGILGMFGAFPAWMKSRHDEKKIKASKDVIPDDYDF